MIDARMTDAPRIFFFFFLILASGFLAEVAAQSAAPHHYWIYLNPRTSTNLSPQELGISERAMKRRAKVLPPNKLIDQFDNPISEALIDQIRSTGATIRTVSRWLNAVSVEITATQVGMVAALPFVKRIRPVGVSFFHRPMPFRTAAPRVLQKSQRSTTIDYGPSFTQLATEHIPDLHALGINGTGVVVGMIDDGFNNHRRHVALKNIHVIAEHDFIHNIDDTQVQPWEEPDQGNHGAGTLSSIAGFDPGNLVGGAFGVSVILAKTEMDSSGNSDFRSEEDTYVAGLEWMERLGADIASSSLAYKDFVPPDTNYSYSSLNGRTTVVAKAASIAALKGVLLCTAMGNEGYTTLDSAGTWLHVDGTLWSPADADSILAVGATFSDGILTDFSGTGPTSDGRTKPDVVAQGGSVFWANGATTGGYEYVQGTSCSTPIVASVAALIFSAHPELTPMQVRRAIVQTAIQINDGTSQTSTYPNNYYGYGLVNAYAAALYCGPMFSNVPTTSVRDSQLVISTFIVANTGVSSDSAMVYYRADESTFESAHFQTTTVPNLYQAFIPRPPKAISVVGYFTIRDGAGNEYFYPHDAPQELITFSITPPSEYVLQQNFPNPFNSGTTITFLAPRTEPAEITIFNVLGQRVKTLFNGTTQIGENRFHWADGKDDFGHSVSSGVYFLRLRTPGSVLTNKMLYLK